MGNVFLIHLITDRLSSADGNPFPSVLLTTDTKKGLGKTPSHYYLKGLIKMRITIISFRITTIVRRYRKSRKALTEQKIKLLFKAMIIRSPTGQNKYKGAVALEICTKTDKGFIEVWLTKEEQEIVDRNEITARLLEVNVVNNDLKLTSLIADRFSFSQSPPERSHRYQEAPLAPLAWQQMKTRSPLQSS